MSLTEKLSNFITQIRFEDLSSEVVAIGKKCFLDWMGVALGGMKDPSIKILIDLVQETGRKKKQASILGYGAKTDILNAAFVNGTMSHVLDYDDAHHETRSHPSSPLIPALLSLAEYRKLKGKDLLAAFVAGYEVSTRIGLALGKCYYESGWHATAILGRFGSAAGVGKLLNLSSRQLSDAIGLAATQAGGIRAVFGTMGKPFHVGKAAMDGMLSALLARKGFKVPGEMLDGELGFLKLFPGEHDKRQLTRGLGHTYQVLNNSFKPHAACLLIHPAVDGLIGIKKAYHLKPGSIQEINLKVSPLCLAVTDRADPKNGQEGKFSLYFCVALAIKEGRLQESQFTPDKVRDPLLREIMGKVRASSRDSIGETEAEVHVKLKDGTHLQRRVFAPKGDPRNPMSFDEIMRKFEDLTREVLTRNKREQIIAMVRDLEKLENIPALLKLCRARGIAPAQQEWGLS